MSQIENQTERLLKENEQLLNHLKKRDLLISDMKSSIHELRTPISAVIGLTELLLIDHSGELSKKLQADIK